MVIQRWQSVLLLLAVIMVAIFCATPFATYPGITGDAACVHVFDVPVLMIVSSLAGILLLLSIFMYKNLKHQMTVTLISAVLVVAAIATCISVTYNAFSGARLVFAGGVMSLVLALLLSIGAHRLMGKDLRKLRSYDRLR